MLVDRVLQEGAAARTSSDQDEGTDPSEDGEDESSQESFEQGHDQRPARYVRQRHHSGRRGHRHRQQS